MFDYTLQEISLAIGSTLPGSMAQCRISGVCIDSRLASNSDLFFALRGEVTDGHLYAKKAIEAGAAAVVVDHVIDDIDDNLQLVVADTMDALKKLSQYHRNKFDIPFIAITGSSGKTTTKDVTASVLSEKYRVLKTQGNLNSTTGVPLTLFNLDDSFELAVIEVSMSHPGEILANAEIIRPETAVITNIGVAHIEYLKTRDNIFKAKSEIFAYLKKDDCAVLNTDDDYLRTVSSDKFNVIGVGFDKTDLTAENVTYENNTAHFSVNIEGKDEYFDFAVPNRAGVTDAMLAIAVGLRYSVSPDEIRRGLKKAIFSDNRMENALVDGVLLINDTYNANPDSMKAACDMLANTQAKRRIGVLCDMYELGEDSALMHRECGAYAAEKGIDILLTTGDFAADFKEGFDLAANCTTRSFVFDSKEEIAEWLSANTASADAVLFKASRGMMLEKVYESVRRSLANE